MEGPVHLTATLTLPQRRGPYPAVVLLSIAGTGALVERLADQGYAVLHPVRRGFVAVEPLLQSTYRLLGSDVEAAARYLRSRADIDGTRLSLIAQADDAPPAMLAAAGPLPLPMVLLAPPGFTGREVFRLEQLGTAEREGFRPAELADLETYVGQIADVVLRERSSVAREYRLQALMATTRARLPYNAAFPSDARQVHFFASPLWYDRLAFEPEEVLAQLSAPVLVVIGNEDLNTPLRDYLAAMRRALSAGNVPEASVCLVQGRTRHSFTDEEVGLIVSWLSASAPRSRVLAACLPDPPPS
jgi:dienelactone hydrolase